MGVNLIKEKKEAKSLAEKMVKEFAEQHKEAIEQNRANGDTFGAIEGIPISEEFDALRQKYLSQVDPSITEVTFYFNEASRKYILQQFTRKDINEFIETLTEAGNHKRHVRIFCQQCPNWNPITEKYDNNIQENA